MDLSRLRRFALARPHVLLVQACGGRDVRWAAESRLACAGWPLASSPADADVLLICGRPGPELERALHNVWEAMPGPRVRRTCPHERQIDRVLATACAELGDVTGQRRDAAARGALADMGGDLDGGLSMAGSAGDRDGLALDALHLSLGPVLPGWPAGLVLDVVLQGDVLQEVIARVLDAEPEPSAPPAAVALDLLARLLRAAGASTAALRVLRARDSGDMEGVRLPRLLRWSLRGLPAPDGLDLSDYPGRLVQAARTAAPLPAVGIADLEAALVGLEVGSAGLVVAAYGPRLGVREVAAHG